MLAKIIDTETTSADDPVLIEYGERIFRFGIMMAEETTNIARYNPLVPISFGAMATHGITNEMVANEKPVTEFQYSLDGAEYMIAHNVDFDWLVVGKPDVKRICTLAMARAIWPTADHKLLALIYMLFPKVASKLHAEAHGVAADISMCRILLGQILVETKIENLPDLYEFSQESRIPKIMSFGKHKGTPIKDLPNDYIAWGLKNLDDEYVLEAFRRKKNMLL